MAARSGNQSGNWMLLQRKIFSRWCASKLESEGEVVKDIVNDLTGYNLVKLMEILSDQECSYLRKIKKTARMRAQHLDGAVLALRFSSELGVEMQVPASAENIVDHDEKPILALIWALMRRFIRFSDDDSASGPSPEESLLMWVNSQISGYDLKPLTKYGSQMHDGMVLAAIVHKHRPKLIDFAAMSPSNKEANLQQVFVAAEKYFHLEQFLTPQEFMSLDNKSMFIYVSEYFYGVARMRKFELAARRIASLIEYTRTNDQMKLDYNGKAQGLRDHLDKVMAVLNDRTIDNTMAGARRKLDEFDQYKEKDKSEIAGQYLDVESFYNHLAVRLSDHHRPAYEPPQLVSAKGLGEALKVLENTEQERSVALHKELNRQIKLVQENDKHTVILSKLNVWGEAKTAYLEARETIESVGAASYHLTMLNAYDSEANQVRDATKAAMKLVSDFLAKEMYENMDTVRQREATADQLFVPLKSLSEEKRRVLDDHLAREIFNEKLRLMDGQHVAKCENIDSFNSVQQAFLEKRVQVDSVDAARAAIVELETHTAAIEDYIAMVPSLKEFGQKICAQKYESAYSKSTFTNGDALAAREARVDSIFATLNGLSADKNAVVQDDMAREVFKSKTMLENTRHVEASAAIDSWCAEKTAYATKKEVVNSVSDAQAHLSQFDSIKTEISDFLSHSVSNFKALGAKITAAKYSGISEWVFPNPAEIEQRHSKCDQLFAAVETEIATKHELLKDHLAREEYRHAIELLNENHVKSFETYSSWVDQKRAYAAAREPVSCVSDAERLLAVHSDVLTDLEDTKNHTITKLKQLGARVTSAKYEHLSTWVFPNPAEVEERHSKSDEMFAVVEAECATKHELLKDHLAREKYRHSIELLNENHVKSFETYSSWADQKRAYAAAREPVSCVSDAEKLLAVHADVDTDLADTKTHTIVKLKQLGARVTTAKYEHLTTWTFPTPEEVSGRESQVDARFAEVEAACAEKLTILEDHLEREEFKVQVHMWNTRHEHSFGSLGEWCAGKEAYLAKAEDVNSVADANRHLSMLDAFLEDRTTYESLQVSQSLKGLGERIRQAKYAKLSEWVFENPGAVTERESTITARFAALIPAAEKKRDVLKAALDLENRKEENRAQYATQAGEFKRWVVTQCESAAETHFGFTLLEVEGFAAKMESEDAGLKQDSQTKQTALRTVFEAGAALGITENCYTSENADSLAAKNGEMETALGGRRGAYAEALKLQRANDQLCKEFATAIEQFSSSLTQHRTDAAQASGELDQQLANVRSLEGSGKEAAELPKFDALEAGLKARDITDNIHTFLSAKDARVLLSQFHTFLQRKAKLIDEQISLKNRRGLTQEQFDDIEKQFDMFDTSKDGKLESAEIRGCLFSLGEELSSKKIKVILEQFGDATKDHLTKEGFTLMMVEKLGDQATKEEALAGFVLINRGQKSATNERMDLLSDPDLAFINKTAPALDDGWNYTVWVDEVYSR
eukprot:947949_1